jgi:hypothetical protein
MAASDPRMERGGGGTHPYFEGAPGWRAAASKTVAVVVGHVGLGAWEEQGEEWEGVCQKKKGDPFFCLRKNLLGTHALINFIGRTENECLN